LHTAGRIAAPPPIQERLPAEDAIRTRHHETSRTPLKAESASMTITTADGRLTLRIDERQQKNYMKRVNQRRTLAVDE
jgi:hypothetical protein